jgi:rhodanese-related sulfurtransferase
MIKSIKCKFAAALFPTAAMMFVGTVQADENVCEFSESRSGLVGCYHSQISSAEAFLHTVVKRGKWTDRSRQAVILDVRSTPEYKAGHPEGSYNVPYPFIYQYCDEAGRHPDGACINGGDREPQDPVAFVTYVQNIIRDKDTPIYTLCRTGVRSVGAANLLKEAGYTEVRNIWEGFVGVHLKDTVTYERSLDVNHDGKVDDLDKNGWRYYQGLPYSTRLLPRLIYKDMAYTYRWD